MVRSVKKIMLKWVYKQMGELFFLVPQEGADYCPDTLYYQTSFA